VHLRILAVFIIAGLMNFPRRDVPYTLVILWALAGIALKFQDLSAVAIPTWITFVLVAVTLLVSFLLPKKPLVDATVSPALGAS